MDMIRARFKMSCFKKLLFMEYEGSTICCDLILILRSLSLFIV